jgi:hypothetical protein
MKSVIISKTDLQDAELARIKLYEFVESKLSKWDMLRFIYTEEKIAKLFIRRYQEIDIEILADR